MSDMPMATPELQREYARKWMAERRRSFFQDKKCSICASSDNLELDHIDPLTKVSHRIWSWSQPRREAEIAKCRIVCKPCHDVKSRTEHPCGELNSRAKLSDSDVDQIRTDFRRGVSPKELAEKYSVHIRTIQKLVYGTNSASSQRVVASRYKSKDLDA